MDGISAGFPPNGVPEHSPRGFSAAMFEWQLQIS